MQSPLCVASAPHRPSSPPVLAQPPLAPGPHLRSREAWPCVHLFAHLSAPRVLPGGIQAGSGCTVRGPAGSGLTSLALLLSSSNPRSIPARLPSPRSQVTDSLLASCWPYLLSDLTLSINTQPWSCANTLCLPAARALWWPQRRRGDPAAAWPVHPCNLCMVPRSPPGSTRSRARSYHWGLSRPVLRRAPH